MMHGPTRIKTRKRDRHAEPRQEHKSKRVCLVCRARLTATSKELRKHIAEHLSVFRTRDGKRWDDITSEWVEG